MESTDSPTPWIVLLPVGVGTFMSALDGSVVNTLLPVMGEALHAEVAHIEWVATLYLLVVSALLLGVGRMGDLRGHKRIYLGGFALFVLGSALCGLAPTAGWLIALRGLQAVGATMLFANAPAIVTKSFPGSVRGRVLGAIGMFTYLGLTTGPSLGGWIADAIGWRWVFYINVPVGALAIALAWHVIADDRPEGRPEPFDFRGGVLFTLGLVALLVALDQGHAWGWGSARVVGLLVASAVLLGGFVVAERRTEHPMLDLTLFRSRLFAFSTVSAMLNYVAVSCVTFLLPFLLIQGRGLSPRHAGLVLTAQPLVMAVAAPVSGTLSDRVGSRAPATIGMVLLAGGLLLLTRRSGAASIGAIAFALAVVGLGVGIFVSPNNSALMGSAPRNRQGIASGVLAEARNVGMVLGVGLAGAVFTTVMARAGAGSAGDVAGLVRGVQAGLVAAAVVAAVGVVTSWTR
jgi:EmrB/QacA subfamily drug resistance transporter